LSFPPIEARFLQSRGVRELLYGFGKVVDVAKIGPVPNAFITGGAALKVARIAFHHFLVIVLGDLLLTALDGVPSPV